MNGGPLRIAFLSHTGRSGAFRVGSHHLAREFCLLGHEVVHISNPISLAHIVKVTDAEVRRRTRLAVPVRMHRIDGALFAVPWTVFPLTPDPIGRPFTLGSTRLLMRSMRKAGFGEPDLLLVDQPLLHYLVDPIGAAQVIYRPTDINLDPLTRAAEDKILTRVQKVIATSRVVADELAVRHPAVDYRVVENGAQISHFSGTDRDWGQRQGSVYVGAVDHRFDWPTIRELARHRPDERMDIFSPQPGNPPDLPDNVRVRGSIDYADLPQLLSGYRVGLLPLNDDPTNDGRSPMKLYEYLASGLNVVCRSTRAISARPLQDVHCYSDQHSAVTAFDAGLRSAPTGDGAAAAAQMDWPQRARLVLEAAGAAVST
jgi:hypothetical protein